MADAPAFGAPIQEAIEEQATQAAPNGSAADAPSEIIDMNDPRLTSEKLDVDVEKDAYASFPVLPDGKYRAKLKAEKIKVNDKESRDWYAKTDKDGKLYCYCLVSASIIDPSGKYDGIVVYPRFGGTVDTRVRKDSSSQVVTLLHMLKQPSGEPWAKAGAKMYPKEWAELLVKALAGEPEAGVETTWEWSCEGCGKQAKDKGTDYPKSVLGMHNFPPDARSKTGEKLPEMKCQVNPAHGSSRARAKVSRFLPLGEVKR